MFSNFQTRYHSINSQRDKINHVTLIFLEVGFNSIPFFWNEFIPIHPVNIVSLHLNPQLRKTSKTLEKHKVDNPERYVQPDVHVGGWNKFIKTEINGKTKEGSRAVAYEKEKSTKKSPNQQPKKGGRGWLHSK